MKIRGRNSGTSASNTPWAVTWLTWPILFTLNIAMALYAMAHHGNYSRVLGTLLITDLVVLVTLEFLFPLRPQWKMTRESFSRDLKYIVAGVATVSLIDGAFGLVSIRLNTGHAGPLTNWPLFASVPTALLTIEFVNYWQHRWSHEMSGGLGKFLWKSHAAHHLPEQVYVFMHPAAHPINNVIVRGAVTVVPLYYLGASPETVLLVSTIVTFQALISHCNVNIRTGWVNYILSGTELHRFHHSASLTESKNYSVTLSFLDVLFGSFYYRPGNLPGRLGVDDPSAYPNSNEFWKVMSLPFHGETAQGFSKATAASLR